MQPRTDDYEVSRPAGKCHVSGRMIAEGERFHTAIIETPQGFERRDYAEDAWTGPPEGALCHFQTRLPKKEEHRKVFVGDEVLLNFFLQLGDAAEASRARFRFVLALILLRKRLLKYERTIREEGKEFWEMRLMRDRTLHRIFNPSLNDEQIHDLTRELGAVLAGPGSDMFDAELPEQAPEAAPAAEPASP